MTNYKINSFSISSIITLHIPLLPFISKTRKIHSIGDNQIHLGQHDDNKTILSNFIVFQRCGVLKNFPLMNKHLL